MKVEEFFDLFIRELEVNKNLGHYYRLLNSNLSFPFRKAYLHQRLLFVDRTVSKPGSDIWDIGCGYGTTAFYLTLNGHKVTGTTLEYYYEQIQHRIEYWSRFGNLDKLNIVYQDLFDTDYPAGSFDAVIVQDTLHHLEPLEKALQMIATALAEDGKLVVSEENGQNLFISIKNYIKRGNRRIIEYHDEKLQKSLLLGNENVRAYACWQEELKKAGLLIDDSHTEFIRFFPPLLMRNGNYQKVIDREQTLWRKNAWLKKYFFFGINFTAGKGKSER